MIKLPAGAWLVLDIDEGLLRVEMTRRAAVDWAMTYLDGQSVAERHQYSSGMYEYILNDGTGERSSAHIGKLAAATAGGFSHLLDKPARYPFPDRPFDDARDDAPSPVL